MPKKKYSHNQYPTTTKSNQCPTKSSLLPNLSHIHTTTKFCHSHAKRKFLHVQKKIPTTSCTNKFSHTQQNLPIPINISMHISTKFCHIHKTKFTHANNFSHIHHEHIHISQTQSFHNANTPKIQTKIHPTTSQITYIVKILKTTNIAQIAPWSKKNTLQEYSKANIPNMINHTIPPKF